ncbi:hypothetical protein H1R16_07745 [Marnyiella aurantia]|jgi:transcriptional regulator NrdR family protein|uniref:Uncharacterized protein n=1 Tax=Marnyiella aurantia TaxID=2758037 RepID=A0A7D7LLH8_9FLAO|nr:hypothetical protein [Marnyiella aurantia]MBA5247047.1 hypothetical protein [Marnyiella aurantia]MBP0612246.1 hypothetical protein [Marnyiella aurantia]QMS97619.1 hypothetical protein H1R16_07745 [Marnyiella aurantia]
MKNTIQKNVILTGILSLIVTACTKTETKIETFENPDGSVTTTVVENEETTGLDTVTITNTVQKAKENINEAGEKIEEVADKAGTELKKAGEDLKVATKKGAEKVERTADKAEADMKKD